MKQRFVFLVILMTVALALPAMLLNFNKKTDTYNLNNAEVNQLLNEISKDWDNVEKYRNTIVTNSYDFNYEVIDDAGMVLIKTDTGMPVDMGRATSERYTIRDIKVDGEVVGKLLIDNDFDTAISGAQNRFMLRYYIAILIEAVIIAVFLFWVFRNIVKPFDDLKDFASDVASCNCSLLPRFRVCPCARGMV